MIDMHIHTNNSDGDFGVIDILKMAEEKNIGNISITDHDTVNAYKELSTINISDYYSGKITTGVEITCNYNGILIEILGYNIDIDKIGNSELLRRVFESESTESQNRRLELIKSVCNKLRIKYNPDTKSMSHNQRANDILISDIITYKENKEILLSMGITNRDVFYNKHYTNKESPFFVDKISDKPNIIQVVTTIKEAGGLCFLPHVFRFCCDDNKKLLDEIISMNLLDGVECAHNKHSASQLQYLIDYCKDRNLLKSGGSDFHRVKHSSNGIINNMGLGGDGSYQIEDNLIENWII